jgi:hypothetical protein
MWAEATEAIQKFGTMVKSPSGYPVQSPYVSIANRQAEIMMRIAPRVRLYACEPEQDFGAKPEASRRPC